MRTVTPSLQSKLDQDLGTEPIILVEIEWVEGSPIMYSDQKIDGADYPYPTILNMGGFDTSMMLSGASDTLTLNMTLDDVDGHLKDIYLANDVHKRPAKVYMTYKGLNLVDKTLLFTGEVVTPFEWDEGKRSLSFTLLSKLSETEVGFSMEEGDFPNIPEEALGKAWPLVFGKVCHVPAVQIRAARRGYMLAGEGIHDFTLHPRLCQAHKITCPSANAGIITGFTRGPNNEWAAQDQSVASPSMECVNRRFFEICKLRDLLDQQLVYEHPTLNIQNGVSFPQNETVTIWIDGAKFKGTFNGNTFTVSDRKHPDYDTFNHIQCRTIPERYYGAVAGHDQSNWTRDTNPDGDNKTGYTYTGSEEDAWTDCNQAMTHVQASGGGPSASWKAYEDMESADFAWLPAGTEVFMEGESEHLFVASLLPATVDMVSAYRTFSNGSRLLVEVPTEYYTVYNTDYDGYDVVEIGLDKKLSLIDEDFDDQIYVSLTSSIGPNMVDIIEWLVGKYTQLSVDTTSFAAVHAAVANYPCNFALLDRMSVYQVMQDLAYQSRCSLYIRNDVVYLTYLSTDPTSVRTIDESDIVQGSFTESLSDTDDIMTTHKITWQKAGARVRNEDPLDYKIILKYNVEKYGTAPQDWHYYSQNTYSTILKSATFWLIRKSISWKKLEFNLPIKHIDLDVNDAIMVDVAQFSGAPVKCVIESIQYNPNDNTISLVVWTPIRAGETEPYFWAWPSQQSAYAVWPLAGDTNGGGGYTFDVTPPTGHILLGGSHREDQTKITTGDRRPSDLDDVFPTVTCIVSDLIDFNEDPPEIVAMNMAQSTARESMDQAAGGGGGGSDDSDDEEGACGGPQPGHGCTYSFWVFWHMSTMQGLNTAGDPSGCGGPCACDGGCPSCGGPSWSMCFSYGANWAAESAAQYFKAQMKRIDSNWGCMEIAIYQVGLVTQGGEAPYGGSCAPAVPGIDPPPDAKDGDGAMVGAPMAGAGVPPGFDPGVK